MEQAKLTTAKLTMEADGNIIGDCFIANPEKDLSQRLGVLFGVIEVYNINDTFVNGLIEAVDDLKTEYYLPPFNLERGLEKRFEEAVARANRRIKTAVSQSIEEVDLRNLSAVLGVVYGNKVYLTSVGRIKGLFVRQKKNGELLIADILSGSQEKRFRPEPEKVFANILSGELEDRDGLLCLNEEFFGFFSQTDLAEIVLGSTAASAVLALETALREKVAKKNFYAIAIKPETAEAQIMETEAILQDLQEPKQNSQPKSAATERIRIDSDPETDNINDKIRIAKKSPHPQQSIDRLLYTQVKTEKYLNPSSLPNWQKLLIIAWGWLKKTSRHLAVFSKKTAIAAIKLLKELKDKNTRPTIKTTDSDSASIDSAVSVLSTTTKIADGEKPELELEKIDDAPIKERSIADENLSLTAEPKTNNTVVVADSSLTARINNFFNGKINEFLNLKKTQQAIIIILTLLVFVFSQSVVMIGRSFEATGGALGYEKIAGQIEDRLNSAEAQNIFNDELGALEAIRSAEELLAQIPDRRTTRYIRNDLRTKIDTASRNLQRISYQPAPTVLADFQTTDNLIGLAKTDKIFWAFNNQNKTLLRLDTLTDRLEVMTSSLPTLEKLSALDSKNLVALAKNNETYKYSISKNETAKTSAGKDYFQIKKYESKSNLIIPSLASSTIEMSAVNDNYLLFLDSEHSRVVALDKNGNLKRQFVSPVLASSTAFASNFTEKKLWVFSDNKVYQLEIDF